MDDLLQVVVLLGNPQPPKRELEGVQLHLTKTLETLPSDYAAQPLALSTRVSVARAAASLLFFLGSTSSGQRLYRAIWISCQLRIVAVTGRGNKAELPSRA